MGGNLHRDLAHLPRWWDGTVQKAQYNVKAKGHVAKLRKDLGLDA